MTTGSVTDYEQYKMTAPNMNLLEISYAHTLLSKMRIFYNFLHLGYLQNPSIDLLYRAFRGVFPFYLRSTKQ
ncbi:hypothetical protein [Vibrio phage J14]|nr:hypothetical protein [Vibrio phage J14]